jgi:hypothetical protein
MEQRSKSVDLLSNLGGCVIDKLNGVSLAPDRDTTLSADENEILTLEMPNGRGDRKGHLAKSARRIVCRVSFLSFAMARPNAHAVLLLLHEKRNDYQNAREIENIESPIAPSPVAAPLCGTALGMTHRSEADLPTVMQQGN